MMDAPGRRRFEIKKYPNRRFYDVSRSRHVTLTDLFELVRTGNEIFVTDSATGGDITNVVLAQIILEHDPPKLDLFPASLLHQAIQANEQMVRKFIDQYFAGAMDAFMQSRKQFDAYLQRVGFSPLTPMAPFDWVRMLIPNGGAQAGAGTPAESPQKSDGPADDRQGNETRADAESLDALREQMALLRAELNSLRADSRPTRGRPPKKKAGRSKKR
mgnify:CR=1 FL=1